jgi:hypothetical protein
LLATHCFHVVFTLPSELRVRVPANAAAIYDLLFDAAIAALQELARTHLNARLGITAVLHTWTREMMLHPHVHCVVTGGGLRLDDSAWVACNEAFLFHVHVMGELFRGKFMDGFRRLVKLGALRMIGSAAHLADPAALSELRRKLYAVRGVVYAKRPFGGPAQVLGYLSRYTHRVAISDARIVAADGERIVMRTLVRRQAGHRRGLPPCRSQRADLPGLRSGGPPARAAPPGTRPAGSEVNLILATSHAGEPLVLGGALPSVRSAATADHSAAATPPSGMAAACATSTTGTGGPR